MQISLMWAMAENRVIGRDNQLPWHLPNDLKHFKQTTLGKPVIMGRKTYESIGRPLPKRTNIVITRSHHFKADGVIVVHSLTEALEAAKNSETDASHDEVVIIGGAQIYQQALPLADRLYVTQVGAHVDGDAYFPEFDWGHYQQIDLIEYPADEANPYPYSFGTWKRM